MFRPTALAAVVLTLALGGTAQRPLEGSSPAPDNAGSRSAVGTIAKYEATSLTLTVATSSGRVVFVLAEQTPVRLGSRVLQPRDLAGHVGARVKVRYADRTGRKPVESVMVSPD
jgi:hypothetical protein